MDAALRMLKTAPCSGRQPLAMSLCYLFKLLGNGLVPPVKDVHVRLEDTDVWTHLQHRATWGCQVTRSAASAACRRIQKLRTRGSVPQTASAMH